MQKHVNCDNSQFATKQRYCFCLTDVKQDKVKYNFHQQRNNDNCHINESSKRRKDTFARSTQIAHPRPTYTDPPLGGGGWNIGELIITNATVCPPHLSTNRRESSFFIT